MVVVAQLVRAPGCGPGGRGFESLLPPHFFCLDSGGRSALPDFFCPESKIFRLKKEIRTSHALRAAKLVNQLVALLCLRKVARLRRAASARARCGRTALACGPGLSAAVLTEVEGRGLVTA